MDLSTCHMKVSMSTVLTGLLDIFFLTLFGMVSIQKIALKEAVSRVCDIITVQYIYMGR